MTNEGKCNYKTAAEMLLYAPSISSPTLCFCVCLLHKNPKRIWKCYHKYNIWKKGIIYNNTIRAVQVLTCFKHNASYICMKLCQSLLEKLLKSLKIQRWFIRISGGVKFAYGELLYRWQSIVKIISYSLLTILKRDGLMWFNKFLEGSMDV